MYKVRIEMNHRLIRNSDILEMDKRHRVNFINSLSGFKSLNLVGTISKAKITNLAPVSSVFHVGANPPLIGMLMRPNSVPRNTLENIIETEYWTLNHVTEDFYKSAHQCSARYSPEVSEFNATNLKEEYTDFYAPYVAQANIKIGLRLSEKVDLKCNGTHLIIGEIEETIIPEQVIKDDGFIDLEEAGSLTVSGLDSYHSTTSLGRLPYAKPQ
jgi:flavin reductase (DIM6/NTAB) family NADH-FMN oxidoreductase RutF